MKRLSIRVYGRVQGVGFRYAAQREARKLHLIGFVRNEADGSVYSEAQGDGESVKKFLAWCHRGPWFANVERVHAIDVEAGEGIDDFAVL